MEKTSPARPRGIESIHALVFPADHPFLFEPFQRRLFRKAQVRGIDACQRCWHPVIIFGLGAQRARSGKPLLNRPFDPARSPREPAVRQSTTRDR